MDVRVKTPLSTLKRADVSVEAERIKKSIDENSILSVFGFTVKTGVFVPID